MKSLLLIVIIAAIAFAVYRAYQISQEESKEGRTLRSLPPSVQHVVAKMDGESQTAFFNEYERKKKKISVGYIFWVFLGIHYLYYGKVGLQFAFWFTFGGFGLWALADLFRMPSIAHAANDQIAREVIQTLHVGTAFLGPENQRPLEPPAAGAT